jgi:hypothetical protein
MWLIDILFSPGAMVTDGLPCLRSKSDFLMKYIFFKKISFANSIDLVFRRVVMEQCYLVTDRCMVIYYRGLSSMGRLRRTCRQ